MYPAGGVHLSVPDWAKFITMQLEGKNGGSTLLTPESFKMLHTAPLNDGYELWAGLKMTLYGLME